tara:strand:+ start:5570 stop:6040 length:471 start_codon:yes stop_codon:yes gene_type:complete
MTGRKSKLTPELQEKFCEGISLGMTYRLACGYVGIGETTFYRWLQEADQGHTAQREFREAIKAAEATGAAHSLVVIRRAAEEGSWQASAWLLERRHCYRRDSAPVVEAIINDAQAQPRMVEMDSEDGRETIIGEVARLPEDMILAALNRKQANVGK